MANAETKSDDRRATPPYTSFQTIKTVIGTFKEHGVPGQIDRSVLSNFSGGVQGQILPALRFLGLIQEEDGAPFPQFRELVNSHGTDEWPSTLAEVLRSSYGPLFDLNLETASPAQFNEKFKAVFPSAEGDTQRKCVTFFLNAAREANIPVSPYILKNTKPRSSPAKKRPAKQKSPATRGKPETPPKQDSHDNSGTPEMPRNGEVSPYDVLMQKIYDPTDMHAGSDEEKAVFTLARYLKMKELQAENSNG